MNLFNFLAASTDNANNTTSPWTIVIYVLIITALIVMMMLSSRRRKKQQEEVMQKLNSLTVGDTIKTIGMICGTIVEMCDDGTIVLQTGSEQYPSYIRIDKRAIAEFNKKDEMDPFTQEDVIDAQVAEIEGSQEINEEAKSSEQDLSNEGDTATIAEEATIEQEPAEVSEELQEEIKE